MMSSKVKILFYQHGVRTSLLTVGGKRFLSDVSGNVKAEQLFFKDDVQDLLKKLTRVDLDKVYEIKKQGVKFQPPKYKFMTTQQYEEAKEKAVKKAEKLLQMPPCMDERKEIDEIFVKDDNLVGYTDHKFVFTDITYGIDDRLRNIVVRDEDGTLRQAKWEERDRMNQIYFPRKARKIMPSKMFNKENLESLLERGEYIFVLDSACCQFEPDDPTYIAVCHQTYQAIDSDSAFNKLRSTRHYGPFVFYLVRSKAIDNLLMENIATDRIEDACWLISLYHIVNPDSKSPMKSLSNGNHLKFIESYIKSDSNNKDKLELTLQTYREYLTLKTSENDSQMNNVNT